MSEWQPIETAPKYEDNIRYRVIVWNKFSKCIEYVLSDGDFWRHRGADCSYTHWMPLPNPPPAK